MAQRASPQSFRLGYNQDWNNYYFARNKQEFTELNKKVKVIREFFYSRWKRNIAQLKIELNERNLALKLYVAQTDVILGENNQNSEKILRELYQAIQDSQIKVDLELVRIKNPYTNAQLVSNMVAEQLEKRVKMRQILNFFVGKILVEPEVRGVRITAEGCLNGAKKTQKKEIARGGMPLNTIDIRIERGEETAIITKGVIGIEVLIYKGKIWTK